jgi:hypothetical protein
MNAHFCSADFAAINAAVSIAGYGGDRGQAAGASLYNVIWVCP